MTGNWDGGVVDYRGQLEWQNQGRQVKQTGQSQEAWKSALYLEGMRSA